MPPLTQSSALVGLTYKLKADRATAAEVCHASLLSLNLESLAMISICTPIRKNDVSKQFASVRCMQ